MVYAGILAHGTALSAADRGLQRCACLHASPSDRHLLGTLGLGLLRHDEPGDSCPAAVTSPRSSARSATPTLIWQIAAQWEHFVHLIASVHSGHTSAVNVLARFGSAARRDPLYEALGHLGRLRAVFLADYFVNEAFRRELLRVLNCGESVNALNRSIYVGRVASYQAKRHD